MCDQRWTCNRRTMKAGNGNLASGWASVGLSGPGRCYSRTGLASISLSMIGAVEKFSSSMIFP